jgi:ASC-1-like (ASCH) protein
MAKKEVFRWVKTGEKTIDVRRGEPQRGETATFLSGTNKLKFQIVKKESGRLTEVVTCKNYKSVIPSAKSLDEALRYVRDLYGSDEGIFTAYHLIR